MGIALTDDHRELSGVARAFLTSQKVRWAARASLDAAGDARPPFWQNLAELGWLGLHIDERHGGSGYGLSELVVVIEEARSCGGTGAVCADRDRLSGGRQRRY